MISMFGGPAALLLLASTAVSAGNPPSTVTTLSLVPSASVAQFSPASAVITVTSNTFPPQIDILKTVFPVLAMTDEERAAARPDFFGTAFAVAPGIFLTAAHVVTAAQQHGHLTLAGVMGDGRSVGARRVDYWETFPEKDVALLYCEVTDMTILNTWLGGHVQVLTELRSFGYPHAVTRNDETESFKVLFRAYKGYVIVTRGFQRLPGEPAVYEVSCPYPEGTSGAPVLLAAEDRLVVAGMVLGVDIVEYAGVEQRVGIAMIGEEILRLRSQRLGGLIGQRLGLDLATFGIAEGALRVRLADLD